MSIAESLAKKCLEKKAAAEALPRAYGLEDIPGVPGVTPSTLRREFEDSLAQEKILREKAEDYESAARRRALTQGGAGAEFFKRLLPIPYSGAEYAWRLPVVAGAGVGGYMGSQRLLQDKVIPEELARVMKTETRSMPGKPVPFSVRELINAIQREKGGPISTRAKNLVRSLPLTDLESIAGTGKWLPGSLPADMMERLEKEDVAREWIQDAVKKMRTAQAPKVEQVIEPLMEQLQALHGSKGKQISPTAVQALRQLEPKELAKIISEGKLGGRTADVMAGLEGIGVNRDWLREAYRRAGADREKLFAKTRFRLGPKTLGTVGALGGVGIGSLLTGLPMAIRAGALRRSGGELAHGARKRMRKAIEKAEREQFRRENILRMMNGETPLPLSEWKARRKQMRSDWRETMGDYRDLARARRKGERKAGVPTTEAQLEQMNA